ncbi:hypothetical protein GR294_25680 [Raoultella sp. Lac2]|uniref:hypothetical protein n=1 Tax=unclassified Raoultella TaxID=2627600 RepID=UPI0013527838|nr:hypothetical protein [Raoultella sp. Lac2]MXF99238.1 hypothetical protein [Raoultella sp. Lac1]
MKMIKYWNVKVLSKAAFENGFPEKILGTTTSCKATIESGFLLYTSLEGCAEGVNLSEAIHFSIEPVYLDEK